jgi:drug/metabolite transporter (DMT)-like permease
VCLSYGGIVLVFLHDLRSTSDAGALVFGVALVLVSAILYAVYLVAAGGVIEQLGSARFVAWAMLLSTIFALTHFLLGRGPATLAQPARVHALAGAMAVFVTVLPGVLIAEAIRRLGADRSSVIGSVGPISTLLFAAWLLGEPIGAIQLVGVTLVIAGVLMVVVRARPAAH